MPKVVIYTMDHCPYCERAKALLKSKNIDYREVRVALDDDGAWNELYARSRMRTMPQIFSDDRVIGGYTELAALDSKDGLASLK